jgi:hypothetical protein|nr:MAG TPA: hypothetical protein [Caudoviricetes sp.]
MSIIKNEKIIENMKILCYYNNVLERNTFTGKKSKKQL